MSFKSVVSVASLALLLCVSGVSRSQNTALPDDIPLPDGFRPEGIAQGAGPEMYAGSLANGSIYSVDLITGAGSLVVPAQANRIAVGLAFDIRSQLLYVAGGPFGQAYVYDPSTGESVASYQLGAAGSLINDVIVTREAAYFTDSFQPFIYRLPFGPGGSLPQPSAVETINLGGDFILIPGAFNANGIESSANGKLLIIVNTATGSLYRVDPTTGTANTIDLGGNSLPAADGLVREGQRLYVVQNALNQISVITLAPDLGSGEITEIITDPDFRIPTTASIFDGSVYVVNARFDTPPEPETTYNIVAVPK